MNVCKKMYSFIDPSVAAAFKIRKVTKKTGFPHDFFKIYLRKRGVGALVFGGMYSLFLPQGGKQLFKGGRLIGCVCL